MYNIYIYNYIYIHIYIYRYVYTCVHHCTPNIYLYFCSYTDIHISLRDQQQSQHPVSACVTCTLRLELTQELLEPESGARVSMLLGNEEIKQMFG